jgi:hypothetical protein
VLAGLILIKITQYAQITFGNATAFGTEKTGVRIPTTINIVRTNISGYNK